jgi:hypothetical protein
MNEAPLLAILAALLLQRLPSLPCETIDEHFATAVHEAKILLAIVKES